MTERRARWCAFCAAVDAGATFADILARVRAEPVASLRRAYVVHVARLAREVVTDAELRELGALFTGKVPAYVEAAIVVRRLRRGGPGAVADAQRSKYAFVRRAAQFAK